MSSNVCRKARGRVREVRERLMAFWHLVCVSWNGARDLLNGTVCTLFIMQAGLIQLEAGPGPVCPLWLALLALSPLLLDELAARAGPRMHWKRSDGPGNRDQPQPSRLLASFLSPAARFSLSLFPSHGFSLSLPGILFSPLLATRSPAGPRASAPCPDLCAAEVSVIRESR